MALCVERDAVGVLARCLHIQGHKLGVVNVGHPCRLAYDVLLSGIVAAHTHHQLGHAPCVACLRHYLVSHLLPHTQCHLLEGQLAQLQDIVGLEEIVECCLYLLFGIYLTSLQALHKFLCCKVDIHNLVGLPDYTVGDAFPHVDTHHCPHLVIQALYVLYVDSRENIDAGIQKFHHILPSLGMAATLHIGVGEFVDNHYLGMHLQDGVEVHLLYLLTLVEYLLPWYDRQPPERPHRVRAAMCLYITYTHVGATAQHLTGILEHTVCLAHSRNHPDVYLEPSTVRPPYEVKEMLGIIVQASAIKPT